MLKFIIDIFAVFGDVNFQKSLVVIFCFALILSIVFLLFRFAIFLIKDDAIFGAAFLYGIIVFFVTSVYKFCMRIFGGSICLKIKQKRNLV